MAEEDYHALNALYFLPNLVTPLLAGFAAQSVGAPASLLCAAGVATAGNLVVLVAVALSTPIAALFAGRILTGLSYEALDQLWMPLCEPHFGGGRRWFTVAATINSSQRAGSVLAFVLSPVLHGRFGGCLQVDELLTSSFFQLLVP